MPDAHAAPLQPLLHDATVVLRAPVQVWSRPDGSMRHGIDGVYVSDVRIAAGMTIEVDGEPGEHIATDEVGASTARFTALHRRLDGPGADPDVRAELLREADADGVRHVLTLRSRGDVALSVTVRLAVRPVVTPMDTVKPGLPDVAPDDVAVDVGVARWGGDTVRAELRTDGATIAADADGRLRAEWAVELPAHGTATVGFELRGADDAAVVAAASGTAPWHAPDLDGADDRVARWVPRALDDLDALRMVRVGDAGADEFVAAGAPWFFTLFGRDSIWAARLLLPVGAGLAGGTLRTLAGLQGRERDIDTAEQPGKIMHELRRATQEFADEGMSLPPLYYGTVDATPLWVCLLVDAWRAGMPEDEVRALLPNLRAALAWARDSGDSDGDGLLEYVDESGRGLSNQGWKDSGDSVQWRDGRLADGPIALAEVQAYAYEAAVGGADLLEALGDEADAAAAAEWRAWAARLAERFRAAFWVPADGGAFPAIALDAAKRPIDSLTSNLGHLLGTGLLDAAEERLVADRLVSSALDSGYGLRTLSTDDAGYWPMSYHGGAVWAHDTAIAIRGLALAGFAAEAAQLAEGLLAAAVGFGYRMPELHAGDARTSTGVPIPYPAACRPQAWSAAAAITVWDALR